MNALQGLREELERMIACEYLFYGETLELMVICSMA